MIQHMMRITYKVGVSQRCLSLVRLLVNSRLVVVTLQGESVPRTPATSKGQLCIEVLGLGTFLHVSHTSR